MGRVRALVLAAIGLAAAGCGKSRTEAVVVVMAEGLRIPEDVDTIHVQVFDAQNPTPPLWDAPYTLCSATIQSGCVSLPLTMTLIPGAHTPSDSTRVVVGAERAQIDRIENAAIFTFTAGQSLRLDFTLYGNCLDRTDCALMNQVCGPDRQCGPIHPVPFSGELDLAQGQVSDAGVPTDGGGNDAGIPDLMGIGGGGDLAKPMIPDLMTPADFTGCVPVCSGGCTSNCNTNCCTGNTICNGSSCIGCGGPSQYCCSGSVCNAPQTTCNTNNNLCECGNLGQPCCMPSNSCNGFMLHCDLSLKCVMTDMGTMSIDH
jgi:hypothetical protein